nr:uncharacterized protein I203_01525 [Kwoniella mangroviensis CBS 8507]OCF69661.1 hypothetical protein I203_01525 [Kwoniella mangroviensis CBS 8507]
MSQASWSEIKDIFTNAPKAKAVRRLQNDLTKGWNRARKERKFELIKDLGILDDKGRIEEITLISTWTQSLVGTDKEQLEMVQRCLSDSKIWMDLRGAERDCLEIVYSRMLTMLDSEQVPTQEKAMFEFDPAKKKSVCDSANNTNSIGRQMRSTININGGRQVMVSQRSLVAW